MGGTLVTDIASLGLLAVVIGATSGEADLGFWVQFCLKVSCFVIGIYFLLPRLGRWFFRHARYDRTTDYLFMISVLFITAYLAELAGLAPIIGAFLAGLLMNRLVPESSTLMSRIQFVGDALLVPFFLVSVGMLVDVTVLGSALVWIKAVTFTLLVLVGKGAATLLGEKLFGFTSPERWVILGLTVPQAAATLAVTLLGFENGLLGRSDVNSVILMILMTCLIGTTLVEKYGRDVALQEEEVPYDPTDAPQRILVPLANPETANHLMSIAFMVKDSASPEPIYPLTVTVGQQNGEVASEVARSEKMLDSAVELAAAAEVPAVPITRIDLNIAKGIGRAINERRISSVIIGWNGKVTTQRRIFGSVLDQLLDETEVLILVCKITKPINLFKRLVVALPPLATWETCFPGALRSVKQLAEQLGVRPVFLHSQNADSHVKERVESVKPELEADWEELKKWNELPTWLELNRQTDDLFVLMSARQGAVSWRSTLNSLPGKVATKFPDLCFVVVYPAEMDLSKSKLLL